MQWQGSVSSIGFLRRIPPGHALFEKENNWLSAQNSKLFGVEMAALVYKNKYKTG